MAQIKEYCGCYLSYIEDIEFYINPNTTKECNFYQHGVCVSFVTNRFKWKRQSKVSIVLPIFLNSFLGLFLEFL